MKNIPGLIDLKWIHNEIAVVEFSNVKYLKNTLIRFSEFYESGNNELKDHYFTRNQVFNWYKKYSCNFIGHNFPSTILKSFTSPNGIFANDLCNVEQAFLKLFENTPERFYICAVLSDDHETLQHEIVHALYYLYPEYQRKVNSVIQRYDKRYKIIAGLSCWLVWRKYSVEVINDEINSYISIGNGWWFEYSNQLPFPEEFYALHNELNLLLKEQAMACGMEQYYNDVKEITTAQ